MSAESGARRYAANAAWLLAAEVAAKIASFVFVVVVARSLGARDFGHFAFALAFVPLFLVLGRLGVESTVVRELARDRARLSELFASGLALRVALGLAGLASALAVGPLFLDGRRPYAVLALIGTALLLDELSGFVGTVFRAFERMEFQAAVIVANRILSTGLAVLAIGLGAGLVAVAAVYLAGSAAGFAVALVALRRGFPPIDYRRGSRSAARALLTTGLPLGVAGILNTALFRVDTVLLQALRGPIEVALYSVAYRFFESLLFVAWALGNLMLPRLSRRDPGRGAAREYEVATALSLAFYLPLAVTLPFAAEWLVTTVFSDRYADAAGVVGVLAGAAVLYALAYSSRIALIGLGRLHAVAAVAAIALAVNVGANAWAIPRYGFEGAAWCTLAAEAVESLLLTALFVRANGVAPRLKPFAAPVVAAGALFAVLGIGGWDGPAALGVAALVYLPLLGALALLLAREELGGLRRGVP